MTSTLRDIRTQRKLTQETVAKAVGISRNHLAQIESGSRTPSLNVSYRIARFFSMRIEDIFFAK